MKVVLITVDDAKKTELKGAEKLAKNDILILMSAKNKVDIPALVKERLEEIKANIEYVKMDAASDATAVYAYYAGLHEGKGHQLFIVAPDKTKLPSAVSKQIKIYTSFASVVKVEAKSTSSKSSSAKTSTKKASSKSNSTESLITDTISSLTGLSKSQTKKLIKEFTGGNQ